MRLGPVSLLVRTRALLTTLVLLGLVAVLAAYALSVGTFRLHVAEVVQILLGNGGGVGERIVMNIRLPRVLTGVFAGAALGASGAVFQSVSRNALGSPDVIGFTTGAATGAIAQIVIFGGSAVAVALSAVVTGLFTAAVVYLLASKGGRTGYRLILIGIGLAAMLSSVVSYTLARASEWDIAVAFRWITGSLGDPSWDRVVPLAAVTAVVVPLMLYRSRDVDAPPRATSEDASAGGAGEASRSKGS